MATVVGIDGGFATQLTQHIGDLVDGDPLWSARFNLTNPEAVKVVHGDFMEAGAKIIRTNTYQASVGGYKMYLGLSTEDSVKLIQSTVKLAHEARDDFMRKNAGAACPQIFGSIGPYGACLADGSEYSGSYMGTTDHGTIRQWHNERIAIILEAGVDGLAIETLPSAKEAEILVNLMKENFANVKFWISFQCRNNAEIASGENYHNTVKYLWQKVQEDEKLQKNFLAFGVNCSHPDNVASLFAGLNDPQVQTDKTIPFVAYPNSGEIYDVVEKKWISDRSQKPIENYIEEWITLGARYVGGCCRNYASNIRRIRETLDTLRETIGVN
uniref:Putative cysteine s-methyltransferase n=1 Tax=Nyssomyia neivai TaxID=330878 RepID=A0A1L8E2K0_9DIPT